MTQSSAEPGHPPESENRPRRVLHRPPAIRNVVTNWLAFAFGVGINFFLSPYVVHSLGDRQYGIWVLLGSLVGYMGLLDLGVRSAVMRYVARHHARAEDGAASALASAGLAMSTALGSLALIASVAIALVVEHLFQIPAELVGTARFVIIVGGLNVACAIVSGVFGGAVVAMQRFDLLGLMEIAIGVLRAIAIVGALQANWGLLALSLIQLACTLARGGIQYALGRRLYPELRYRFRAISITNLRKITSFSIYTSLLHVTDALIFWTDSVVIGAFLPVATITFFAIAANLTEYARSVISAISQTVTPRVSALDEIGEPSELRDVLLGASSAASLVVLPIAITFLIRGPSFIGLWMGSSYAELSGQVLLILSVALCFAATRQVVMSAMIGLNQHLQLIPFYVAEGVLNVALSVYWIHSMGIIGVALGTAVPNLVTSLIVIPWAVRRSWGISPWQTWWRFWIRPILAMIPFAAVTYAVERLWPAQGLVTFFAGVAAALPAAALGAWFIGLSSQERRAHARAVVRPLAAIAGRA